MVSCGCGLRAASMQVGFWMSFLALWLCCGQVVACLFRLCVCLSVIQAVSVRDFVDQL